MRITYVLGHPELGGGYKVVFQHAGLLRERRGRGDGPGRGPEARLDPRRGGVSGPTAGPPRLPGQDLVIATYWTTLAAARDLALGPLAHFCQGYEGGLAHLRPLLPRIEEAYSWPLPALVVSPHLGDFLRERFGRESRVAPPPLDPLFRPAWRRRPRRRPWIAIPGIFEAEVKGVPTALRAVAAAAGEPGSPAGSSAIRSCRCLRGERALLEPDRYARRLRPGRSPGRCGAAISSFSRRAPRRGSGCRCSRRMAAKVPAVASRIPSTVAMAEGAVALVPPGDAEAFARQALGLLASPQVWRRARELGFQASRRFLPAAVAPRLFAAVDWARERALQSTTAPS